MIVTESAPLVLGSASPRRREILVALGIPIRVVPGDIDEGRAPGEAARDYVVRVVLDKLADVVRRVSIGNGVPGIVVADTIVVVDGDVLGKPRDVSDACVLLSRIVGRSHSVFTRYAIAAGLHLDTPVVERTVESIVTMRPAAPDTVARYAATREGLDKAGAYAAQGIGSFLIQKIDGSFSNVVGLPACEVVQDLVALGLLDAFPRLPE